MSGDLDRDLGEQPIARLMAELGLSNRDLVEVSTEQITHKMVARAKKGRRLSERVQWKVLAALNRAAGKDFERRELFDY